VRYGNTGEPFEQKLFADLRDELAERFGGITAYTRAPVRGVWQEIEQVVRDDLISYEIMIETLDENGGANSVSRWKTVSSSNPSLSEPTRSTCVKPNGLLD